MAVAALLLTPLGLPDLTHATAVPHGVLALVLLGAVSTGVCFALFAWLAGTLDPTRASVVTYAVPVIALAVGVLSGASQLTRSRCSESPWCSWQPSLVRRPTTPPLQRPT